MIHEDFPHHLTGVSPSQLVFGMSNGQGAHARGAGKVSVMQSATDRATPCDGRWFGISFGMFNGQGAHARGAGKVSGHAISYGSSYAV